ncbi:UNVERIFIED_CONTAM: hypothetical protein PYX00_002932 [Menopon gallinae]|uniref:Sas10 C-terminal domain-containing protein n=1 Tax=Menopon gallinae TaxID=328185 RepID=A0AAW2HYF4_9NEOP
MAKGRKQRKREPSEEREESMSDDDYELEETENFFDDSKRQKDIGDEEVFGFGDSDDLEDEEEFDGEGNEDGGEDDGDFDMGSDIAEDDDKLPDDRAWGKKNRNYYSTDYVDQDYEGFYEGQEAEDAELEEQEARQIQKRLIEELNEADFVIAEPTGTQPTTDHAAFEEIKRDVSNLTSRQKLDLLQKESPEFLVLVDDFKAKLREINDKLLPVTNYFEKKQESSSAIEYLKKKLIILTNYCTNISFYLLLKSKGLPVENHPVLKSLYKYRKLMQEMSEIDKIINPQIDNILKAMKENKDAKLDQDILRYNRKDKKILKLLAKSASKKVKETENGDVESKSHGASADENYIPIGNIDDDEDDVPETKETEEKRAITYEMAKNKGLMPKRNKDQRNPRVKHRKKYRKALIRRRGQVRTPRAEIPVYGGEATGIKAHVTKSIKLFK